MKKPKFNLEIDTDFNRQIELAAQTLYPIFHLYGWTWWGGSIEHIPTRDEIIKEIKHQVDYLLQHGKDSQSISSGRISSRLIHDGEAWSIDISLDIETLYDDRGYAVE